MILVDTGPLVAMLDGHDSSHARCASAARALSEIVMLTTWPCFTEAMYLLGEAGGFAFQSYLWQLRSAGRLQLHLPNEQIVRRMAELMEKYADVPMDLADASLIATAEGMRLRRIFTLDSDFHIYRLRDGSVLDVVP